MAEKLPLFKLSIHPLQTCDPENYANPVSVSTTPYTGDGAGVGLAESGDAHPTPAPPLSPGASSVCVKPNEPNPDLTDCSQVTQSLCKDHFTESLVEKKISNLLQMHINFLKQRLILSSDSKTWAHAFKVARGSVLMP